MGLELWSFNALPAPSLCLLLSTTFTSEEVPLTRGGRNNYFNSGLTIRTWSNIQLNDWNPGRPDGPYFSIILISPCHTNLHQKPQTWCPVLALRIPIGRGDARVHPSPLRAAGCSPGGYWARDAQSPRDPHSGQLFTRVPVHSGSTLLHSAELVPHVSLRMSPWNNLNPIPGTTAVLGSHFAACSICAQSKSSTWQPAGLLQPLTIPKWPWSHIFTDFVTGLPDSEDNSVILTVVDRFSKMVHFHIILSLTAAPN